MRRANYRARLTITIDGQPANALPVDENGATLILTAADPTTDVLVSVPVATNLTPERHTAEIITSRGWDQWALNGFSVGFKQPKVWLFTILNVGASLLLLAGLYLACQIEWQKLKAPLGPWFRQLDEGRQMLLTGTTAVIVALSGWLTWGEQAAGIYRRLGDSGQLALTAAAAAVFYVAPSFYVYLLALAVLFLLLYFRPAWGLALVALCFPLSVPPLLKPILNYRFSATEIFMLLTFTAVLLRLFSQRLHLVKTKQGALLPKIRLIGPDVAVLLFTAVATLSLFFSDRVDVASNEWRTVIIEPVLFYFSMRLLKLRPKELWLIVEAVLLSGLIVAGYGFWQYISGSQELITAEGGLLRIRSFYGSPNNVGLYLGRILPILVAFALMGPKLPGQREDSASTTDLLGRAVLTRRRWLYGALALLVAIVLLLTFSRGAILLGVPAALLFIFWQWQRQHQRRGWPWFIGLVLLGAISIGIVSQIPQLAGRFNLQGQTSFFRINLWRASWRMFWDHPLIGVGLDNFLYAYRGEYILSAAWQEPDLNHPHNIFLDFGTRLGLLGLATGGLMFFYLIKYLRLGLQKLSGQWLMLLIGMSAVLIDIILHGLVDHSYFLVDLAFYFYVAAGNGRSAQ